jgi:hypothetical protein
MQIQSTQRPQRLRRTESLTPKGQLDQQLSAGVQDVVDLGSSRTEYSKSRVRRDFGFTAVHYGILGGAFGLAVSNISPVGGLVGVGLGTYVAWNKTARKSTGKVEIRLDGETRQTRYYGRPENYTKTPQEVRAEMISRGQLGERIKSYNPDSVSGPTPELSPSEKKSLKKLADESRLVADFGQRSEYGIEVLNRVDSLTAARLMKGEKPVYVLDGESQDTKHTLEVVAKNNRSTVRRHDSDSYIERTFHYSLTPLDKESLQAGFAGEGLPESFQGVYKGRESCALIVGLDEQAGVGIAGKNFDKTSFSSSRVVRGQNVNLGSTDKARVVTRSSINVRDVITMGGVALGMVSGMALSPGVPHAALIGGAVGGVFGRELGWLAQDRMPSFQTS